MNKRIKIGFLVISIVSVVAKMLAISFQSGDYVNFLLPWVNQLKADGGVFGLANYTGNYNAVYVFILALFSYIPIEPLYLIKGLSIIFDIVLAVGGVLIVRELIKEKDFDEATRDRYYLFTFTFLVFMLPALLNSAFWGQCDSIYSAFAIFSILYLLRKDYKKAFIFLGVSFSFKLQAVFLLPLFGIVYFRNRKTKERFSFYYFFIIPAVDFAMCLPAVIFGWPLEKLITIYFVEQVGYYGAWMSMYFPNIYNYLEFLRIENIKLVYVIGVLVTLGILVWILWLVVKKKVRLNKKRLIELEILTLMIVTYFLPAMHERYFYIGEALVLIYYMVYRENRVMLIATMVGPLFTYCWSIYDSLGILMLAEVVLSTIYSFIFIYTIRRLYLNIFSKEITN